MAARPDPRRRGGADPGPPRRPHAGRPGRPARGRPAHVNGPDPVIGLRRDPAPDLDAVGEDEALAARIRDEIARDGPMPFARFMELALYDPDGGYYRATEARPGRAGDFLTAPETHPIFGAALAGLRRGGLGPARRAGSVRPARVRRGDRHPRARHPRPPRADRSPLREVIAYEPVEVEPGRARGHLRPASPTPGSATACSWRASATGRSSAPSSPTRSSTPCRSTGSGSAGTASSRSRSGSKEGAFAEVEAEPRPGPGPTARRRGHRARRRPDAPRSASRSTPGSHRRPRSSSAVCSCSSTTAPPRPSCTTPSGAATARSGPTSGIASHDDPYRHVGRQDLTAHVDVTAVEQAATAAGLEHLATTTQAEFLVGLGTEDAPAGDPDRSGDDPRGVPRRPIRADAAARPGRDGTLPGDGVRARLAGRPAARRARLPGPAATGPPNGCQRTRAIYLLPPGAGGAHDSRRSGTT